MVGLPAVDRDVEADDGSNVSKTMGHAPLYAAFSIRPMPTAWWPSPTDCVLAWRVP